ncbi:MAG TPA: hypothetical protein VGC46_02915 [Allosphingosinicella sp.]
MKIIVRGLIATSLLLAAPSAVEARSPSCAAIGAVEEPGWVAWFIQSFGARFWSQQWARARPC